MSKFFRTVIMGPPGSGRGTISSRIVRDFKFSYFSSGDALREQISKKTSFGITAKKYIDKGELVPDELLTNFMLQLLRSYEKQQLLRSYEKQPLLLDGFPRTIKQAEDLSFSFNISLAVNLVVPDEIIISRVKGRWLHPASGRIYHTDFNPPKVFGKDDITGEDLIQRYADKPEVVLAKLKSYRKMNLPLLDYYRKMHILREFEASEANEIWPILRSYILKEFEKEILL